MSLKIWEVWDETKMTPIWCKMKQPGRLLLWTVTVCMSGSERVLVSEAEQIGVWVFAWTVHCMCVRVCIQCNRLSVLRFLSVWEHKCFSIRVYVHRSVFVYCQSLCYFLSDEVGPCNWVLRVISISLSSAWRTSVWQHMISIQFLGHCNTRNQLPTPNILLRELFMTKSESVSCYLLVHINTSLLHLISNP